MKKTNTHPAEITVQ